MPRLPDILSEESILWFRWSTAVRSQYAWLDDAIADFDPGTRPAARVAARWLRDHSLAGESQAYLAVVDRSIVGFYALTVGQVVLSSGHRRRLGYTHSTQGAVLITWLAKSARHQLDGGVLLADAIGIAIEVAHKASATVLALDPFDRETSEMWQRRYAMRASRTELRMPEGAPPLRRLYLPLSEPAASELDAAT